MGHVALLRPNGDIHIRQAIFKPFGMDFGGYRGVQCPVQNFDGHGDAIILCLKRADLFMNLIALSGIGLDCFGAFIGWNYFNGLGHSGA